MTDETFPSNKTLREKERFYFDISLAVKRISLTISPKAKHKRDLESGWRLSTSQITHFSKENRPGVRGKGTKGRDKTPKLIFLMAH